MLPEITPFVTVWMKYVLDRPNTIHLLATLCALRAPQGSKKIVFNSGAHMSKARDHIFISKPRDGSLAMAAEDLMQAY